MFRELYGGECHLMVSASVSLRIFVRSLFIIFAHNAINMDKDLFLFFQPREVLGKSFTKSLVCLPNVE